jgi:uncharacterized protein with von Willebrand factor type A (vWA) domain
MRGKLLDFSSVLRFAGMPVSIPELIEAGHVLGEYYPQPTIQDKEAMRLLLMSCLLKEEKYRSIFQYQFERWWDRWFGSTIGELPLSQVSSLLGEAVRAGETDTIEQLLDNAASQIRAQINNGEGDWVGEGEGQGGNGGPLQRWSTNRSVYERLKSILNFEQIYQEIEAADDLGLWERNHALRTTQQAEAILRKAAFSHTPPRKQTPREEGDISEISISRATFTQIQQMKLLVPDIVRKLSHRKKYKEDSYRGILQFRKTMRHSLAQGGIPIELFFKRKAPKRERIALLCDLSGSMELFSGFALQLAHSFSSQFAGVRCFGFISDIDEITRFVSSHDFPHSMKGIYAECNFVSGTDNSDYGHVFRRFQEKFLTDLGRSTSVLMIGDARTNGTEPGLEALTAIRLGVKELHWLNPEPKNSWDYGDSMMGKYKNYCDSVHPIHSVKDLAAFIANLKSK